MEDKVVKEIDVYLTKELAEKLWLMQYPVRPAECSYEDDHFISTKVKPLQKKVSIEVALDTSSNSYLTSKGEHIAMSVDGPIAKGPPTYASLSELQNFLYCHSLDALFNFQDNPYGELNEFIITHLLQKLPNLVSSSGKLDKIELASSESIPKSSRYAIAAVKNGQLHLTPLAAIVQMRPHLGFLDKAEESSKARAKLLELDGESSQDEEEEVKAVTVKFAKQETAEQKSRRMQSYDYLKKKQSEEMWVNCSYHKMREELSAKVRHKLLATNYESVDSYSSSSEYLNILMPKPTSDAADNPDMPSNVLSFAQLKTMPLNDQIKAIVTNAKVIKWSQLTSLLDSEVDRGLVLKALQQVAVLVQGCWVIKSDILYPKDSFSAHSDSPAEVICRARDYMLWRFTQSPSLSRKDISSIVKIPAEELKEMFEQIAKPKVKQGWVFNFEFDHEFVNKNREVVQRQQMLWDAKYQQLCKHFKLTKEGKPIETNKGRRRRHSSRSKSRSDVSDNDGEKTPNADQKKEFTFDTGVANNMVSPMEVDERNGVANSEGLVKELSSLLRDKILVNYVLNMNDMRRMYQTKLAQCPPGHILATGVTDIILDKAILSCGTTKVHYMNPPGSTSTFYLLAETSDGLTPAREALISLLQQSNKIKTSSYKQELERRNITMSEDNMKNIIRDYCVHKAGAFVLKGSLDS